MIFHDNDFEVFIDPDGDTHEYYELEMNALGTVWDLLLVDPYRDGGRPLNFWDIRACSTGVGCAGPSTTRPTGPRLDAWRSRCRAGSCGRPRRSRPPRPGDQWRINFSRVGVAGGGETGPT